MVPFPTESTCSGFSTFIVMIPDVGKSMPDKAKRLGLDGRCRDFDGSETVSESDSDRPDVFEQIQAPARYATSPVALYSTRISAMS